MTSLRNIAGSTGRVVGRSAVLLFAAGIVAAGTLVMEGRPVRSRDIHRDERARFASPLSRGLVQFFGEAMLTAGAVYLGRRWLRIRL